MRILEVNSYKYNKLKYLKVFFIATVTFKYNSHRLFKSVVPADYYTTELIRVLKPWEYYQCMGLKEHTTVISLEYLPYIQIV